MIRTAIKFRTACRDCGAATWDTVDEEGSPESQFEENLLKLEKLYADRTIQIGRVVAHIKNYRFVSIEMDGRAFHSYADLMAGAKLFKDERTDLEDLKEVLDGFLEMKEEEAPAPYIGIRPLGFDEIRIYSAGNVYLTDHMMATIGIDARGDRFIHKVFVSNEDIRSTNMRNAYVLFSKDGVSNDKGQDILMRQISTERWAKEQEAFLELGEHLDRYNTYSIAISQQDGVYEFSPEVYEIYLEQTTQQA